MRENSYSNTVMLKRQQCKIMYFIKQLVYIILQNTAKNIHFTCLKTSLH